MEKLKNRYEFMDFRDSNDPDWLKNYVSYFKKTYPNRGIGNGGKKLKITLNQIIFILTNYNLNGWNSCNLGKKFGVSRQTISNILQNPIFYLYKAEREKLLKKAKPEISDEYFELKERVRYVYEILLDLKSELGENLLRFPQLELAIDFLKKFSE